MTLRSSWVGFSCRLRHLHLEVAACVRAVQVLSGVSGAQGDSGWSVTGPTPSLWFSSPDMGTAFLACAIASSFPWRSPVGFARLSGRIGCPAMSQRALTMSGEWIKALICDQLNYFLAAAACIKLMSTDQNGNLSTIIRCLLLELASRAATFCWEYKQKCVCIYIYTYVYVYEQNTCTKYPKKPNQPTHPPKKTPQPLNSTPPKKPKTPAKIFKSYLKFWIYNQKL